MKKVPLQFTRGKKAFFFFHFLPSYPGNFNFTSWCWSCCYRWDCKCPFVSACEISIFATLLCLYYGMSFFVSQLILYCMAIPFAYTLTCWWTVGFVPPLSFCKTNAAVHTGVPGFSSSESTLRVVTLGSCVHLYLASWDNAKLYSTAATPFHIPSSKAWAFQFSISTNMDI